jgi:hypothetical protein
VVGWQVLELLDPHVLGGRRAVAAVLRAVRQQG